MRFTLSPTQIRFEDYEGAITHFEQVRVRVIVKVGVGVRVRDRVRVKVRASVRTKAIIRARAKFKVRVRARASAHSLRRNICHGDGCPGTRSGLLHGLAVKLG